MNTTQLVDCLEEMGVPGDSYSIDEESDESYCLVAATGRWSVYYSERGNRNQESIFTSERSAWTYTRGSHRPTAIDE